MICNVCFHHCHLTEGQVGFCRVRTNKAGKNVSVGYGLLTSMAMDPIEKKPFARYHPGSKILSVGSFGCNLRCPFCQNYTIAQAGKEQSHYRSLNAGELVEIAKRSDNLGIAFTYNEPLLNYEYIMDCSKELRKIHKKCVVVTNGCVEKHIIEMLLPHVDAWNIDCKGFDQSCYDQLNGNLEDVKRTIAMAAKVSHVEVTSLIVPGINDDPSLFAKEIDWLASISIDMPLHITRYFPCYTYSEPATSMESMYALYDIAEKKLKYVYLGNC